MLKINLYTNINNYYLNILSKSVLHIFPIDYIDKNTKIKLIKVLGGMEMKEENFINVEYEDKRFQLIVKKFCT